MPILQILSESAIKTYDKPPRLNASQRKQLSYLKNSTQEYLDTITAAHNKLGFLIQYVYFKATGRFFPITSVHRKDCKMLAGKFKLGTEELTSYHKSTSLRHREEICKLLGYRRVDSTIREELRNLTSEHCKKQMKPRLIFGTLIEYLHTNKIEGISYYPLAEIISNSVNQYQSKIVQNLHRELSEENILQLDELLKPLDSTAAKPVSLLNTLSSFNHKRNPKSIKKNCRKLETIRTIYNSIVPVVSKLSLSPETVRYYAEVTLSLQLNQLLKRDESRYLYLLCFIIHQQRVFQDRLMESLIDSVTKSESSCEKQQKEQVFQEFKRNSSQMKSLSKIASEHFRLLAKLRSIQNDSALDSDMKYEEVMRIIDQLSKPSQSEENHITDAKIKVESRKKQRVITLESHSVKLQNKVSEVVKHLSFDKTSSEKSIYEAILYFKENSDTITQSTPMDFLDKDQKKSVKNGSGKVNVSLYKTYLFYAIKSAIQSGALNLAESYKFSSFDSYLIPIQKWNKYRESLLEKSGLEEVINVEKELSSLKQTLEEEYTSVRDTLEKGENSSAKIDKSGKLAVSTPPQEDLKERDLSDFLPKTESSLFEVLNTINESTGFTNNFEHLHQKNSKKKPSVSSILAGVTGYGCNIGVSRMGRLVRAVDKVDVDYATRWHFSVNNLHNANNKILRLTEDLQLSTLYTTSGEPRHTSSDGQKFSVGIESQDASYSHKYFGTQKGVSVYSFIDREHKLFHSTVMTPSEREASYVIDGLLANEVVQSEIHSTDTHGYSEVVFAVTHLMGVSFAPRIKSFKKQHLYSFKTASEANKEARVLLSQGRIKTDLIEEQWEHILRFMATIKLKETTASQLFKRLSSYSRQHPLYRALKQFGRIIKTIFILRYVDDVELRQSIEKQLNRVESYHQFGKAIFFARNQEFNYATREEQLIAEGCKRLIANAIICWNYLYLSKKICNASSVEEKTEIIESVKTGSVVAWHHINFQGEYDFSKQSLQNAVEFDLKEIMELNLDV